MITHREDSDESILSLQNRGPCSGQLLGSGDIPRQRMIRAQVFGFSGLGGCFTAFGWLSKHFRS